MSARVVRVMYSSSSSRCKLDALLEEEGLSGVIEVCLESESLRLSSLKENS